MSIVSGQLRNPRLLLAMFEGLLDVSGYKVQGMRYQYHITFWGDHVRHAGVHGQEAVQIQALVTRARWTTAL